MAQLDFSLLANLGTARARGQQLGLANVAARGQMREDTARRDARISRYGSLQGAFESQMEQKEQQNMLALATQITATGFNLVKSSGKAQDGNDYFTKAGEQFPQVKNILPTFGKVEKKGVYTMNYLGNDGKTPMTARFDNSGQIIAGSERKAVPKDDGKGKKFAPSTIEKTVNFFIEKYGKDKNEALKMAERIMGRGNQIDRAKLWRVVYKENSSRGTARASQMANEAVDAFNEFIGESGKTAPSADLEYEFIFKGGKIEPK